MQSRLMRDFLFVSNYFELRNAMRYTTCKTIRSATARVLSKFSAENYAVSCKWYTEIRYFVIRGNLRVYLFKLVIHKASYIRVC